MKRFLISLAAVMCMAVGFNGSAFAQGYGKASGTLVTLSSAADATYEAVSFGFYADMVEVCASLGAAQTYMVFGTALPTNATSAANFVTDPNTGRKAMPLTMNAAAGSTEPHCASGPWNTNGLVFHSAGTATVDVRAYAK